MVLRAASILNVLKGANLNPN